MNAHVWKCVDCGHEVFADEKPELKWSDGHRCNFQYLYSFGAREVTIDEGGQTIEEE